jgi:hypothetical protein
MEYFAILDCCWFELTISGRAITKNDEMLGFLRST